MDDVKDAPENQGPSLAQLTQSQIEYLISTVHEFKPELDELFKRATMLDLLVINSYISAVFLSLIPSSQDLIEQLINLFMNMYPAFMEADYKENGASADLNNFRIVIPVMPPRKSEDEFLKAVILEQAPVGDKVN